MFGFPGSAFRSESSLIAICSCAVLPVYFRHMENPEIEQTPAEGSLAEDKSQAVQAEKDRLRGLETQLMAIQDRSTSEALVGPFNMLEKYDIAAVGNEDQFSHLTGSDRGDVSRAMYSLEEALKSKDPAAADKALSTFELGRLRAYSSSFEARMEASKQDATAKFNADGKVYYEEGMKYDLERKDATFRGAIEKIVREALDGVYDSDMKVDAAFRPLRDKFESLTDQSLALEAANEVAKLKGSHAKQLYDITGLLERRFDTSQARTDGGPSSPVLGQYSSIRQPFFKRPKV